MPVNDYGKDNTPFFILGCVRSGTTMLRDMLRLHPRLECPEETHFFRWADPFASPRYDKYYISMKLFEKHRTMDGISHAEFFAAREQAEDRREMADLYGQLYLKAQQNFRGRWFDKTPQNIYGIFLISHLYPEAKFIHIHRHPLNVVASLVEGRVMARHGVKGAVNYWLESMILIQQFKRLESSRLLEISYERATREPLIELARLFEFIGEDFRLLEQSSVLTHPEKNNYQQVLTLEDQRYVIERASPFMHLYGYDA